MHIKDKYCKDCGTLDRNIAVSLRTTPPEGQPTVAMPIYKEQQGYALGEEFSPNARIAFESIDGEACTSSLRSFNDSPPTPREPFPEGWTEYTDSQSGNKYYHNIANDTTQWDHPGLGPPLAPAEAERSRQAEESRQDATKNEEIQSLPNKRPPHMPPMMPPEYVCEQLQRQNGKERSDHSHSYKGRKGKSKGKKGKGKKGKGKKDENRRDRTHLLVRTPSKQELQENRRFLRQNKPCSDVASRTARRERDLQQTPHDYSRDEDHAARNSDSNRILQRRAERNRGRHY